MTISSISSSYSQARMLEMRQKMFTSLDTNGDGTVSKDELAQMVANGPKNGPSADELLSKIDTDGNGSVSQSEFMAGPGGGQQAQGGGMAGMSSSEFLQQMFTNLDANGDGSLSTDELDQMVANGPTDGPSADQLLSQMDTDGNGSVSQSEFMAGPGGGQQAQADQSGSTTDDYFSSIDTNGDGYISKSEFEAAMGESTSSGSTSSVQGGSQEQKLLDKLLEALGTAAQTTSSTASTTSTSSTASTTSQSGTSSTSLVEMLGAALASYMQLSSSSLSQTSVSSFFGSGLYV